MFLVSLIDFEAKWKLVLPKGTDLFCQVSALALFRITCRMVLNVFFPRALLSILEPSRDQHKKGVELFIYADGPSRLVSFQTKICFSPFNINVMVLLVCMPQQCYVSSFVALSWLV